MERAHKWIEGMQELNEGMNGTWARMERGHLRNECMYGRSS